jgi:acetylornithine deacetylase
MEIVPLLQQLIAIDSTSSRSNLPVLDLLERAVRPLGFDVQRTTWTEASGVEKGNLLCRRGPDAPGGLALLGHTDCVPFDAGWPEALSGVVRDGRVYGRGAADTKGFVACAVAAAARARDHRQPLWLVFTADEEVGCTGAKKLVEEGRPRVARAIVGEPTRLTPVRANKGYCAIDVEVTGVEGHSAYPDVGASAIHAASRLLHDLLERVQKGLEADADPLFHPPWTTLNVGLVHGGKARNILAGSCTFSLEWRPIPGQPPERVLRLFEAAARRLEEHSGGKIKIVHTPMRVDAAAVTPADAGIVRFLEAETGNASTAVPFGTELPELLALGVEACVFGPGDIRVAHRTGEHVPLADLDRVTAILEKAIRTFCG